MTNSKINYTILSNNINKSLLSNLKDYSIINDIPYDKLKNKLENYLSKIVVFNETFYFYTNQERKNILTLLKKQNINFINITSNVEETLFGDYIYVLNDKELIMEGPTKKVLQEEKILKHMGFGLPFVVDLSIQLKCYGILDKIYYDMGSLVKDLWT